MRRDKEDFKDVFLDEDRENPIIGEIF